MSASQLLVIGLMLLMNALLAAYEMALASVTRVRLEMLQAERRKGSAAALFMKTRIEGSLATVQLGITVVGAVAAATGGAGVEEQFAPYIRQALGTSELTAEILSMAVLIVPLSLTIIVFGELVPKVIALNKREWVVLRFSPSMRGVFVVLYPVVALIERIVKAVASVGMRAIRGEEAPGRAESLQELRIAASLARTSRLLGMREERIVLAATQLTSRAVGEIVIPAADIATLSAGSSVSEAFLKAHLDMHTRFPVTGNDNDTQSIIGFANFKDIISAMKTGAAEPTVRDITRPIERTDRGTSLSQLLETMIQKKMHIALVTDGLKVLGMVTIEDIMEELVGDIEDEYDYLPSHIQAYGNSWIMGGGVPMNVAASTAGVEWPEEAGGNVPALEQWCSRQLGRIPEGGEIIEAQGLRVMPRKFRRKKMSEAVVSRIVPSQ